VIDSRHMYDFAGAGIWRQRIHTRYGEPSGCGGAGTRSWTLLSAQNVSDRAKWEIREIRRLVRNAPTGSEERTGHLDGCCRLTWTGW
jgi:hypothetical protein